MQLTALGLTLINRPHQCCMQLRLRACRTCKSGCKVYQDKIHQHSQKILITCLTCEGRCDMLTTSRYYLWSCRYMCMYTILFYICQCYVIVLSIQYKFRPWTADKYTYRRIFFARTTNGPDWALMLQHLNIQAKIDLEVRKLLQDTRVQTSKY